MPTSVTMCEISGLRKRSKANDCDLAIFPHWTRFSLTTDTHNRSNMSGWFNCVTDTSKCFCQKQSKLSKKMSNFVFMLIFVFLTNCRLGYTAVVRNPSDLGDIIDLDHEYLTYHTSYHNNNDVIDTIQYYFRLNKGDNYVPLRRNKGIDLSSPLCYLDEASKLVCESTKQQDVHFYHDDDHTVAVAISNENGTMKMRGIVNRENHTHEFQPLESPGLPNNRYHVIRKRWTANMVRKKATPYNPYKSGSKSRYTNKNRKQYKKLPKWVQKDTGYCIDVLCVVDYSIYKKFKASEKTDKYAMEKIRYYYAHVINGINMRYSTIAQKDLKISVRLAGYFIAKTATDLPFIDSAKMAKDSGYRVNSNYTLTELDAFLKRNQRRKSLPDYNHAMLFLEYASTNLGGSVLGEDDGHIDESVYQYAFQHGEPKDGVSGDDGGTSFVSGICSDSKSTSLVVDHGAYTSAGIGTHELGHNLGVYWHDGEGTARGSKCNAALNYIMAPASYLIDERNLKYSFTFSQCSTSQIRSNLENLIKAKKNCLQCSARTRKSNSDKLIDKEVIGHMEILPGQIDNVHVQCKQLYGEGSFMCPPNSPDEMCYRMYCYDPTRSACAIISEQMAATGTPCGKYKVCKMGKCVSDTFNGRDVPDDCPYPDIPSYGAHCEDAMPFMCKNEKFRQKCCRSCSKKFTPDEMCKDVHIMINNMTCSQLMVSPYGQPGCATDYNVKNMCCQSCKQKFKPGSYNNGGIMIHIGMGSGSRQYSPAGGMRSGSRQYSPGGARSISQIISNSMLKPRQPTPRKKPTPYKVPYKPVKTKTTKTNEPPTSCKDSERITINNKECPALIRENAAYCKSPKVLSTCCRSCWPHV